MPTAMDLQSTASSTLLRPPTLPTAGLEPTRHQPWILSPLRLPFRHVGVVILHVTQHYKTHKLYKKKFIMLFSDVHTPVCYIRKLCINRLQHLFGQEGIRTPEVKPYGFQNRRNRPLCHPPTNTYTYACNHAGHDRT